MEEKASSLPEFYIFRARAYFYYSGGVDMPQINSRLRQKIDTETNWNKATNFIPLDGEIIIYKADENYSYERIKIGDGETTVTDLAFINSIDTNLTQSGQAADAKAVGDAIENKVDKEEGKGLSTNDYTTEEKEKLANLETGSPISLDRIDEICGAIITAGEEARL